MAPKATRAASRRQEATSTLAAPETRRMTRSRAARQGVSLPTSFATPPDVARGRRRGGELSTVAKKPPQSSASLKTPPEVSEDEDEEEEAPTAARKELSSPIVRATEIPSTSTLPDESASLQHEKTQDFVSRLVESRKDAPTPVVREGRSKSSPIETPSRSRTDIVREKRAKNWQERILERKRKASASIPEEESDTSADEVSAKRPKRSNSTTENQNKGHQDSRESPKVISSGDNDLSKSSTVAETMTPEHEVSTPAAPKSGFLSSLRNSIAGSAAKLMGVFTFRSEPPLNSAQHSAISPDSHSAISPNPESPSIPSSPSAAGHGSISRRQSHKPLKSYGFASLPTPKRGASVSDPTLSQINVEPTPRRPFIGTSIQEEYDQIRSSRFYKPSNRGLKLPVDDPLYLRPMLPRSVLRAEADAKHFRKRAILRYFGQLPPEDDQECAERVQNEKELWTIESKKKRDRGESYEPFVPSKRRKLDITWDELPSIEKLTRGPFLSSNPEISPEKATMRIHLSPEPVYADPRMLIWDEQEGGFKKSGKSGNRGKETRLSHSMDADMSEISTYEDAHSDLNLGHEPSTTKSKEFPLPSEVGRTFEVPSSPSLMDISPVPAEDSYVGRTYAVPDSPTSASEAGSVTDSPSYNSLVNWSMCQTEDSEVGRTYCVPELFTDSESEDGMSTHSETGIGHASVQRSGISQTEEQAHASMPWSSEPVATWTRDQYVDFAFSLHNFNPSSLNREALRRSTMPEHDRILLRTQTVVKDIYERAFFELREHADVTRREIREGLDELKEAVAKEKSQLLYVADELQKRKAGIISQYDAANMLEDVLGASPNTLTNTNDSSAGHELGTPSQAKSHMLQVPETPLPKSSSVGWSENVSFDHSTPGPHKPAQLAPGTPKSILKSASKFAPKRPSGLRNVEISITQSGVEEVTDEERMDEDDENGDALDEGITEHEDYALEPVPEGAMETSQFINGEQDRENHKPYEFSNFPTTQSSHTFHQVQKEKHDMSQPPKTAESVMRDVWTKNLRDLDYLDILPEDLNLDRSIALPSFIPEPEPFIDPKDCLGRRAALESGKLMVNGKAKAANFFIENESPSPSVQPALDDIILPNEITQESRINALLFFK